MQQQHFSSVKSIVLLGLLLVMLIQPQYPVFAAGLSVTPITWDVIGLDSNDPSVGPNHFPVGVRACNTSGGLVTDVRATWVWDSTNAFINLRPGTAGSGTGGARAYLPATGQIDLANNACTDFYFEVEVTRNASAYDTTRRYHIDVTANGGFSGSGPRRELYAEHLISQSRNYVFDIKLNGTSVPAGGTMTLVVGQTYTITINGATATQGYNQLEEFINFPNTIFQVLSVNTTYSAPTTPPPPNNIDKLYGDACTWDANFNSPTYRSCIGEDYKNGGTVTTVYTVKILKVPGSPLVNPQPLQTLIYDFSGSSFHYNSDYGVSTRFANIVSPATISKSFSPNTIEKNADSTLTFTINNIGATTLSNVNFADTTGWPAGLVVKGNQSVTYTNCGAIPSPASVSDGATSFSASNLTIAGSSSCTISFIVTSATDGVYPNTTGNLFIGTDDTGNNASAALAVSSTSNSTATCTGAIPLCTWNFGIASPGTLAPTGPNISPVGCVTDVSATLSSTPITGAAFGLDCTTAGSTSGICSWIGTGGWTGTSPALGTIATPPPNLNYFQFDITTSRYYGLSLSFNYVGLPNNQWGGTNRFLVYSDTNLSGAPNWGAGKVYDLTKNTPWRTGPTHTAVATGGSKTRFFISATGASSNTAAVNLDEVVVSGCLRPNPPTLSKTFSPAIVGQNVNSTLTFTFSNPNASAISDVSFSDTLPNGLKIATPNGLSAITCTSGSVTVAPTITATAGTSLISMSGASLSANATNCRFSVDVVGAAAGSYHNVSNSITSTETGLNTGGANTGYGDATLTVVAAPVIAKAFGANSILTNGTTTLTFSITNPNASTALTGVQFSPAITGDTLPGGLVVATPNGLTPITCTPGGSLTGTTIGASAGSSNITLTGGTLSAGATCYFSVNVTGTTIGLKNNSVTVSSTNGGTGNTSTASILVKAPESKIVLLKQVGLSATGPWKSFVAVPNPLPQNVYFKFRIENTGDTTLTNVRVNDLTLPGLDVSSCNIASLAQYAYQDCIVEPVPVTTAGAYENTANATSDSATSTNSTAQFATAGLVLIKNVAESSLPAAGNLLHYTYIVLNNSAAALTGPITVADDKTTVTCPAINTIGNLDGSFDPGESMACTATYTVLAADVTAGSVINVATATAANGGSPVTSNTDSQTVRVNKPDLRVTKTNDVSGSIILGGSFNWTLQVTNTGATSATFSSGQTILSDQLPAANYGTSPFTLPLTLTPGNFTNITNSGDISCSVDASRLLTCTASGANVTIGALNGSFSVAIPVTPTAAGSLANNNATVDPNNNINNESNETNNAASNTVTVSASLTLRKSWVNAIVNNAVDVTATRSGTTIDTLSATANTATETDTDSTPVGVSAGDVITFAESFTPPASASNYSTALTCTGNANALSGNQLTIAAADTAIVCTYTNTINLLPVATDNSYNIDEGGTASGNVMTDGTPDTLGDAPTTVTSYDATSANGGTVTVAANGSFTYDPPAGFTGTDTFDYTITDSNGDTSTATVTVNVNALPNAVDDSTSTLKNTPVTTPNVLNNDDQGDAPAIITAFDGTSANGGTVTDNGDGTFDYDPPAGFTGTDTFTYTITDSNGDTSTATVSITVTNLLPVATDNSYNIDEGGMASGNVMTDGTPDTLGDAPTTVTSYDASSANGGTVTVAANGSFTYDPPAGFTGTDTFTYTITDSNGDTSTATVTVNVNALPNAVDDSSSTLMNTPVTTPNVLTNDDQGDAPATITAFDGTSANGGTVTDNGDGTFDYDPPVGFTGTDTFTYTITDSNGDTSTATVSITVNSTDFTVTKTVTGVDTAGNGLLDNPGEVIEYQIEVTNTGTLDLTGVTVSDPLLQGTNGTFSGPIESLSTNSILNVGETWTYTGTYTVQQADFDNYGGGDGDIDNTVTADTNETSGQIASASVAIVPQPGINVAKTITNTTINTPQEIQVTYFIFVENTGNVPLSNIQVTDDLASAFALADSFNIVSVLSSTLSINPNFDGDTDSGANPTHINLLDGTDSLAPGANGTITLVVLVDTGGRADTYTNSAVSQGTPPSGPDVTDSDSIPGPSFIDPALTKAVNPSQASVGDTVTFTITVFNNGNVAATNVVVIDPLPDNLDYVSATSIDTVTSLPRGTITVLPPRTVQVDIGNLATTDVIEITIVTRVNALGNPPIQNRATIAADPPPLGVSPDPVQNNVSAASLQILTPSSGGGLSSVQALPATGFAPNKMTILPEQTVEQAYSDLGDLWLEIPRLGVKTPVVGVPKSGETWNVDWLWEQAGWLQGTAFPTWQGNSVLTGHVYLSNGKPGPFVDLSKLRFGEQVIVHAFGQRYIYEVRTNHIVMPDDMSPLKHEEKAWLTLLTCKGYDESSDTYKYRIEVRAVLIKVVSE